ncbi:ankyrin repeat-containing protein ITN1-like [Solanum pennellii]|uniref:Ankyrin repeat-containing protein ITN1-like n=1 Tax=Solanum pennellii TaxID=28526 RepID=A0ABM1HRM4_SOLPN|nr:ankyrin repeat-containing protein ITN1-like [Solanum pennellii]
MSSINQQGLMDLEMGLPPAPHPISNMNYAGEPSSSPSPRAPALVVSHSSKALIPSNSGKALFVSNSGKALLLSNSGKRMDPTGKKKYVKQVTGRHNDTELHLAAQRGDVGAVRDILGEIDAQMLKTMSGAEFDAEVSEIREAMVNEVNELGETALFTAAERGYIDVVKELLPYSTKEGITTKNRSGLDPLHIAANQGHQAIVKLLLEHEPELSKTVGQSNATPLVSAATKGHTSVVHELLSKDSSLLEISRSNGKNALHLSARQGHVDIVQALLDKDPQLARRTDKKGQTALHMAVKGVSCEVVKLLLRADPAIVMLPDKFGNTALHIATRKKRSEIVQELLMLDDTNVNALTRENKTALDIAEGLPMSEESTELKECLQRYGACRANELNQPRDELRKTVTEIKKNVHSQLEQARRTNKNMTGIAKELQKLHREGINTATNSVTIVASLFATVAFAAIFTVPGGDLDSGYAVASNTPAFKIFYITNALALFTSLAVVVVQITVVRGETKSEKRVIGVINKLMWLAAVFTSLAFVSASYVVIGKRNIWAAIFVTVVAGIIMAGVLGAMTYYVVKSKRIRKIRKREKFTRTRTNSFHTEISDSDLNPMFAL